MKFKNQSTPDAPKNESGLIQMIMMGKSIRQIWVNCDQYALIALSIHSYM